MEQEIYIIDENDVEHRLKYLDVERIIVQTVTRYPGSDTVSMSMPMKPLVNQLDPWPFTDGLKKKITEFHAQFTDAK